MSQGDGDKTKHNNGDILLGRLGAQMEAITEQIKHLDDKLDNAVERLIRIEAGGFPAKLKEIEDKVSQLETERFKRQGVTQAAEWLPKYLGWFVAASLFIANWAIEHWKI